MSVPEQFSPQMSVGPSLADQISYWQGIFDAVPVTESAVELRAKAQEDLDICWPFMGEMCDVFGMAKVETWSGDKIVSRLEFIDTKTAESFGLVIAKVGATAVEKWQVCFRFAKVQNEVADDQSYETIYLLPKRASIAPHRVVEKIFESVRLPHELLLRQSDELAFELQDSEFLTLSKDQQQWIIEEKLESATQLANQWGGIEKPILIENAIRAYVRVDGRIELEFQEIALDNIVVTGNCSGLEVLARAQLMSGRPINNIEQLVDSQAGLFLTVIISPETAMCCNLTKYQDLYVPISGQYIGVTFLESVDVDQ